MERAQQRDPGLVERHLAFMVQAERIAGLGSWEWTPQTGELLWSDNQFRLFGLEPDAITPSLSLVLERVHPDDRQRVNDALAAIAADEFDDEALEYRIVFDDGRVVNLRATYSARVDDACGSRRIVGAVQDVTMQRRLGRKLAAHVAVTQALGDWTSLEQGAHGLLARLAQAMELAFAALWIRDGAVLALRAMWHLPSPTIEPVAAATRRWQPGLGSAGIGRACGTRQPVVAPDPGEGAPADRRAAMHSAGIRGTMIVPAVSADETLAVFELLSIERVDPTEQLVRALDGIGHEVGQFLSHRRGELTAAVLTPRELEVLQLAARGRSAAAIAKELYLSSATVKRHFERAYAGLGVSDRAAAVGEAMRRGLIT